MESSYLSSLATDHEISNATAWQSLNQSRVAHAGVNSLASILMAEKRVLIPYRPSLAVRVLDLESTHQLDFALGMDNVGKFASVPHVHSQGTKTVVSECRE